jgi:hypothetical protein
VLVLGRPLVVPVAFPFSFEPAYRFLARLFGVAPRTALVTVGEDELDVRFGPWRVRTALANVAAVERTGPYSLLKTLGPAHLSLRDRGLTFATNRRDGVCIRFREPVAGMEPTGRLRHPGLTVSVADSKGLEQALRARLI